MSRFEDLIEGYFQLRQQSEGLRKEGDRFQGQGWHIVGKSAVRYADDHTLIVYRAGDGIEACVVFPDGTTKSFS